jgi:hypothetical protein
MDQYADIIDEITQTAIEMKDQVSELWWNEYEEKIYVFDKLKADACYWAPEIIKKKFWNGLFKLCSIHFNNASNPIHREIFTIYQKQYNIAIETI